MNIIFNITGMKYFIFITLLTTAISIAGAQKITHLRKSLKKGIMTIKYDLHGDKKAKYHVQLFASENEGNEHFKEIFTAEGDVGKKVKAGKDKMIIWDTGKDLKEPDKIKFRIEARAVVPE